MRKMIVIGRLGSDAAKKMTQSGREFITFSLANNEYFDQKDSQGKPITYWFDCITSAPNHITLSPHLTKGKLVAVSGIYSDAMYDGNDGKKKMSRRISVEAIDFVNDPSEKPENSNGAQAAQTQAQSNANQSQLPNIQTSMGSVSQPAQPTTMVKPQVQPQTSSDDDDLPF